MKMLRDEQNWLTEIYIQIKNMLDNGSFNYINSYSYNGLISKVFNDLINDTITLNSEEDDQGKFYDNYTDEEYSVLDILEVMFKSRGNLSEMNPYELQDKIYIENYFNQISVKFSNRNENMLPAIQNYAISSAVLLNYGNSHHKKMMKDNAKKINNLESIFQQHQHIAVGQGYLHQNNVNEKNAIINMHNKTMALLTSKGLYVWKVSSNKLYYRPKAFEKEQKVSKAELSDIAADILGFYVDIYDSTDDVMVIGANYLIIALLSTVRKDIFNPLSNFEFPLIANNLCDRNTFEYSELLNKRFEQPVMISEYIGFIEELIATIFPNEEHFHFMMLWFASFFKSLMKSNITVVLIGNNETTNIIVDSIIRPIFAKRKGYLSVINDNVLAKESDDEKILKEKIFYHINDLSAKTDCRRVSKLARTIIKPNSITPMQAWENDERYIFGELLVTSNKDNPFPYLKDIYSSCVVFKVKHIDDVLSSLKIDYPELDEKIANGLDDFTSRLLQYNNVFLRVLDTDEKLYLHTMKNGLLVTPALDIKINKFIEDVRGKNTNAFKLIKSHDEKMYEELLANFDEGMIAQPMHSIYFNIINGEELIPHNGEFLNILQQKVEMYMEVPNDKSKANGKKRYQIF
jgi:hypothetical protein